MLTVTVSDLEILARTVYGEARGESPLGQVAVAYVICNRVKSGRWGKTVAAICQQPWQFSCWLSTDPNREKILTVPFTDPLLQQCYTAALHAVLETAPDPTFGADHYLAEAQLQKQGKLPRWFDPKKITARIGNHTFLRLAD